MGAGWCDNGCIRSPHIIPNLKKKASEFMKTHYLFEGSIAVIGTVITALMGGWDTALKILVVLMVVDYMSGFLAAYKLKKVNSDVMFWGGVRKGVVFIVVIIAVLVDELVNNGLPIMRTLVLYYYIAREALSVTENFALLGVPLPQQLVDVLTQLQEEKQPRTIDSIIENAAAEEEQVTPISSEVSIAEVKSDEKQKEAK